MKCLMIDDDLDDQEMFQFSFLEAFPDSQCYCVNSCADAIEKLSKNMIPVPEYIFMDWNMPSTEARECIHDLRKFTSIKDVPLFILSGIAPPTNNLSELAISGYLVKQPSVSLFSSELSRALHMPIKSN